MKMLRECIQKMVRLRAKDLRSFNIVNGCAFCDFTSFCLQTGALLGVDGVSSYNLNDFLPHPTTISRNTQIIFKEEREKLSIEMEDVIANSK